MEETFNDGNRPYFIFTTSNDEEIRTLKVDFKMIDKSRKDWVKENPPPDVPLVNPSPTGIWGLKLARQTNQVMNAKKLKKRDAEQLVADRADPVPDPEDETYLSEVKKWEDERFRYVERLILTKYLLYRIDKDYLTLEEIVESDDENLTGKYITSPTVMVLREVMKNQDRFKLTNHFLQTSRLTWELVLEVGDDIGLMREGKPILRGISSGSGESQSIIGQGKVAASSLSLSPFEYDKLTINEQAEILALYLSMKWREYYDYEDAKEQRG